MGVQRRGISPEVLGPRLGFGEQPRGVGRHLLVAAALERRALVAVTAGCWPAALAGQHPQSRANLRGARNAKHGNFGKQ